MHGFRFIIYSLPVVFASAAEPSIINLYILNVSSLGAYKLRRPTEALWKERVKVTLTE
jgi:hypothetical protein